MMMMVVVVVMMMMNAYLPLELRTLVTPSSVVSTNTSGWPLMNAHIFENVDICDFCTRYRHIDNDSVWNSPCSQCPTNHPAVFMLPSLHGHLFPCSVTATVRSNNSVASCTRMQMTKSHCGSC